MHIILLLAIASLVKSCTYVNITSASNFSDLLMHWCTTDVLCNDLYFQQYEPNSTLFSILTSSLLFNKTMDYPLQKYICNKTENTVNQQLWILLLTLERFNQPNCGPNFKPIFHIDTLQMECVCAHDRMCQAIDRDKTLSYIIAALMVAIALVLAITNLYRVRLDIQSMKQQCAGEKKSTEAFLKKFR